MAKATKPPVQRFRVLLTEKRFHHLDVLAHSQDEAAGIAFASPEWWVDDDDGDSDVSIILPVEADDPHFYPPKDVCETCRQTMTPDEVRVRRVCDKCQKGKAA